MVVIRKLEAVGVRVLSSLVMAITFHSFSTVGGERVRLKRNANDQISPAQFKVPCKSDDGITLYVEVLTYFCLMYYIFKQLFALPYACGIPT